MHLIRSCFIVIEIPPIPNSGRQTGEENNGYMVILLVKYFYHCIFIPSVIKLMIII